MQGESIGPAQLLESLDEWDYSTVERVVQLHEFEPGQFDYKAVLNPTREPGSEKLQESIRKTACSMANTDGGFILFGIQDRGVDVQTPLAPIVGIPLGDDLRSDFGRKTADIQPDLFFDASPQPILLPRSNDRGIFVVQIPASLRRPHMVTSTGVFYRRGAGGTAERMTVREVRDQMVYTEERLRKLALLRIHLSRFERIASSLYVECPDGNVTSPGCRPDVLTTHQFNTAVLDALTADAIGLLPSSPSFIDSLLDVSLAANQANMVFDEGLGGRDNPWAWARAAEALKAILTNCRSCQGQLEEMWGSLVPDKEPLEESR
jgi:hypothetical protein